MKQLKILIVRYVCLLLFLYTALPLSSNPPKKQQGSPWQDTSFYNAGQDVWTLEITSTARQRLTCTFTIDGWRPTGSGPQQQQIHQNIALVVPAYAGFGAAIVSHTNAPNHISNFRKTVVCG